MEFFCHYEKGFQYFLLGIGSCWIHRAKEMFEDEKGEELLKNLGLKDEYEGIGCVIGYAKYTNENIIPRNANRVYKV